MKKIGLDIDGVIADFMSAWHNIYPEIPSKPNSYDFDKNMVERLNNMEKEGVLDEFYLNIKPFINPDDLLFEIFCYVTARPVDTRITETWLKKFGFPNKTVYTTPMGTSKVKIIKEVGVEIFIDDYYNNFVELNNNNIFTYLYTAPWNENHDVGHMRLNSLKDLHLLV